MSDGGPINEDACCAEPYIVRFHCLNCDAVPETPPMPGRRPGHLTSNPGVLSGQLCFEGTRIPITTVQSFINGGRTDAEILTAYPTIRQADIDVARAWAGPTDRSPLTANEIGAVMAGMMSALFWVENQGRAGLTITRAQVAAWLSQAGHVLSGRCPGYDPSFHIGLLEKSGKLSNGEAVAFFQARIEANRPKLKPIKGGG